ncbi:Cellulose synthase (UDP-forming) [Penicillium ucsense]|uniref:Cellulose synthase (UDP-forming) n=1 Tax=Penicillium ucsense TaxID=2839758 RepID=A0A8J8WG95_9EURO|nr:Cellulose synthase (UDP-forming) [Penicillium ucsense]KAF7729694.1 Cellulose synthase (UDP-forming) [Penicillium ucsense]
MAADLIYDIRDLPDSSQASRGQKYRAHLYHVARLAIWTSNVYLTIRGLAVLLGPHQWQTWMMFLVEAIFIHLSRKDQNLVIAAFRVNREGRRRRLRLQGNEALPRVDVLLPCCGEDVDVIMATVRAACALDYPSSCFRVLVLDDGGSATLKEAVSQVQTEWSHVSYHSRGRQSGMVFAKSGNLNYALTELQRRSPPEFCAVLDADSVPTPDFLRATLPHLLQCDEAALISTRQYFSNLPTGDPLSQTRSHFYTCQNAALDMLGRAIDAGSGAVFRRSAVVHVGLYPTFSFSEDWQLSQILHGMGWRTFQVQEPLQFGLIPDSLTGHCAQRSRWNIGHAQQMPAMLSPEYKHYPTSLRWSIALNGLGIIAGEILCFLGFLAVPLLFVSRDLVPRNYPSLARTQIVMSAFQVLMMWVFEYLQAAQNNFQSAPFAHLENKWLAGSTILAVLKFYLVSAKPKGSSFVTGSVLNSWNRRASSAWKKMQVDLWKNGVWYNICLLSVTIWTVLTAIRPILSGIGDISPMKLLTSIAFPPLLHVCYLTLAVNWVPVAYVFNPPRYPVDEAAVSEKSEKAAPHPHEAAKDEISSDVKWPMAEKIGKEILQLGTRLEIQEQPKL